MSEFSYQKPFPLGDDQTEYRLVSKDYVSEISVDGKSFLKIDPKALELLAQEAMQDVSFYLRSRHLEKVAAILKDPEASDNDRFEASGSLRPQIMTVLLRELFYKIL